MQADTSPDSSNMEKFRREFEALYRNINQLATYKRLA
jgi:hypothetical protein